MDQSAAERAGLDVAEVRRLRDRAMSQVPDAIDLQAIRARVRAGTYEPDIGLLADQILERPGLLEQFLA
jgi:hypothetical protein